MFDLSVLRSIVGGAALEVGTTQLGRLHAERRWRLLAIEADLCSIARLTLPEHLIRPYRLKLLSRDERWFWDAVHEIHGVALLACLGTGFSPEVPKAPGSKKNYDARVVIGGIAVQADVKTRVDDFPFNMPADVSGERATLTPQEVEDLGEQPDLWIDQARTFSDSDGQHTIHNRVIPEAKAIRDILEGALSQLPESGVNILIFSQLSGDVLHLESALFGAPMARIQKRAIGDGLATFRHSAQTVFGRSPTGAFTPGPSGEPFRGLSAVLWMRLVPWEQGQRVHRFYKLLLNENAATPLPREVLDEITWEIGYRFAQDQRF